MGPIRETKLCIRNSDYPVKRVSLNVKEGKEFGRHLSEFMLILKDGILSRITWLSDISTYAPFRELTRRPVMLTKHL